MNWAMRRATAVIRSLVPMLSSTQGDALIQSPARGGKLTLTMLRTEPMSGPVVVTIYQPGLAPWSVTATHPSKTKYKATFTLKSGGDAGTLVLVISGHDKYGGYQESQLSLTLR